MRGEIEKRGNQTYRLRVELGRDDDGKRHRISKTYHGTRKAAETELSRMLADVGIVNGAGGARTIDEVVETYLRRTREGRYVDDARGAWGLVPERFRLRRIGSLHPGDFEELYDELADSGVSAWRIRRVHGVARAALNLAARRRWISANPALLVSPPRVERKTPKPPSRTDVARLVAAADDELLLWIRLASTTGARRGEIAGLRWSDVDLDRGELTIARAVTYSKTTGVRVGPTKTENVRRVALGPKVVEELSRARDEQEERSRRLSGSWSVDRYVVGDDPEGFRPWRPDRASRQFRKLRDRLGLGDDVRLKELRHFVATELIAAGVDVVTVAGRLGHASPTMTADVYASALEARDRDAADLLD